MKVFDDAAEYYGPASGWAIAAAVVVIVVGVVIFYEFIFGTE